MAGAEGKQRRGCADVGEFGVVPQAAYAAVGTINAAIVALAKAFSDRGITDGVQVNSVLPGPVMTGRRRSYLAHWAPLHDMTVEQATAKFPQDAGIARYGEPEEIAELMAFLVSPPARWMTGSTLRMDGGDFTVTPRGLEKIRSFCRRCRVQVYSIAQ
jgi:3-oxoacyl-[acyl-carrier protein] reductase